MWENNPWKHRKLPPFVGRVKNHYRFYKGIKTYRIGKFVVPRLKPGQKFSNPAINRYVEKLVDIMTAPPKMLEGMSNNGIITDNGDGTFHWQMPIVPPVNTSNEKVD